MRPARLMVFTNHTYFLKSADAFIFGNNYRVLNCKIIKFANWQINITTS